MSSAGRQQQEEEQSSSIYSTGVWAPGEWYRHETEREIAYLSQGAKGQVFMSAPRGSKEAAFYDAAVERRNEVCATVAIMSTGMLMSW